ncbi:MAG: hypothetical protein MHPSP_002438, partial [Paramarteilia canceri]
MYRDLRGATAVHHAVDTGLFELLPKLLSRYYSFDCNTTDNNGNSALHLAAQKNCVTSLEILIKHGANIDRANYAGKTPLHYSLENECDDTADLLLLNSANVMLQDLRGYNAIDLFMMKAKSKAHMPKVSSYMPKLLDYNQKRLLTMNSLNDERMLH